MTNAHFTDEELAREVSRNSGVVKVGTKVF